MELPPKGADEICNSCAIARAEYRTYLEKRLYDAAVKGRLKLWRACSPMVIDPSAYESPHLLAVTTRIERPDLVRFCHGECLHATFDEGRKDELIPRSTEATPIGAVTQPTRIVAANERGASPEPEADDGPTSLPKILQVANYKDLARAFRVLRDEDANLKWFQRRCMDHEDYSGFHQALFRRGGKGRGNANQFNVEAVLHHLLGEFPDRHNLFFSGLRDRFPEVFEKFEGYVQPDK